MSRKDITKATIATLVSDTLRLVPSIAPITTFPKDNFKSVTESLSVTFAPNSVFGELVDVADRSLVSTENLSDDVVFDSVATTLNTDLRVQDDLQALTTSLANTTSQTYRIVTKQIAPQADALVKSVTEKLTALESRSPDQAAGEDKLQMVNWGLLSDPQFVSIVANLAYQESKTFVPGRDYQPYYVDGCLAAASRFSPKLIGDKDVRDATIHALETLTGKPLSTQTRFLIVSNANYNPLLNDIKAKIKNGGAQVVAAAESLSTSYEELRDVQAAIMSSDKSDTISPTALENVSNTLIGLTLALGAVEAARNVFFGNTVFFGKNENGAILVNEDQSASLENLGLTNTDLVTTYQFLEKNKFAKTSKGYGADLVKSRYAQAKREATASATEALERAEIESQQLYQKTIAAALESWTADYINANINLLTVSQEELAKMRTLLPIKAVKSSAPLGDLVMDYMLKVYGVPALEAMDTFLRESLSSDRSADELTVSAGRTMALGKFISWFVTQPKYLA